MSSKHVGLVLDHFNGSDGERLALLVLADHADAHGICYPSYRLIAARAGCSERSAIRRVQSLIDSGFVELVQRGGRVYDAVSRKHLNYSNTLKVRADRLLALPNKTNTVRPMPRIVRGDACVTPAPSAAADKALTSGVVTQMSPETARGDAAVTPVDEQGFSTGFGGRNDAGVTPRGDNPGTPHGQTGVTQLCHPNQDRTVIDNRHAAHPVDNAVGELLGRWTS